jgi:hypothetical protein
MGKKLHPLSFLIIFSPYSVSKQGRDKAVAQVTRRQAARSTMPWLCHGHLSRRFSLNHLLELQCYDNFVSWIGKNTKVKNSGQAT